MTVLRAIIIHRNSIHSWENTIRAYKSLMDATKDKDVVTYNRALTILQQEVEHDEDLQSLREDLGILMGGAFRPV